MADMKSTDVPASYLDFVHETIGEAFDTAALARGAVALIERHYDWEKSAELMAATRLALEAEDRLHTLAAQLDRSSYRFTKKEAQPAADK